MSFFLKGKPRKVIKRKNDPKFNKNNKKSKKSTPSTQPENQSDNESIDSDLEFKDVPDRSDSEGEYETAQEKKVRLAKKYLEEIKKEEQERAENNEVDDSVISKRLKNDYLEQQGRLHKCLADSCQEPEPSELKLLRCKEIRLSITCLCITADGKIMYSGSKCSTLAKWSLEEGKKLKTVVHKKTPKDSKKFECHSTALAAVAVSSDGEFVVSCERDNNIQVWSGDLKHLNTFRGHRDIVTDLAFIKDSHRMFSCSADRSVKLWSLDEMSYVESLFGHQSPVTAIDALTRERAVTSGGRDASLRVWKVAEESQLIFNAPQCSVDGVKLINEEHFISCGDDGSLCIWGSTKKKPLCSITHAHGVVNGNPRWITSVAALVNSDIVASGSHDGYIKLWKLSPGCRKITPLFRIAVQGFINSLVFTPDGSKLIAGVGQEHKLARWWKESDAKNGIYVIPIVKSTS